MLTNLSDIDLLHLYATRADPRAFETLAARHLQWIYSAAVRQTKSSALAEEVAQAVLISLSQKAPKLLHHPSLPSWLFQATRFGSLAILRSEKRRKHYEEAAAMQNPIATASPPSPSDLESRIDAALARLSEPDRRILLLRFYQNLTHAAAATALHISEEAARKRTDRALEKLRTLLSVSSISAILPFLTTKLLLPLPPTLTTAIPISTASTLTLTKTIHTIVLTQKLKLIAAALLLLTLPTTVITILITEKSKAAPAPVAATSTAPTTSPQFVARSAIHTVLIQEYAVPINDPDSPLLTTTTISDIDHGKLTHVSIPKYHFYSLDDGVHLYNWEENSSKVTQRKFLTPKKTPEQLVELPRITLQEPHPELDRTEDGQKLFCYAASYVNPTPNKISTFTIYAWLDSEKLLHCITYDTYLLQTGKLAARSRIDYTYNPTLPPNIWNLPDNADITDGDPTLAQLFPPAQAYASTESDDRIFSIHGYFVEPNGNTYIMCSIQPTEDLRTSLGKNLASLPSDLIPRIQPLPDYTTIPFATFRGKGIQVYFLVLVAKHPNPTPPTLTITFPTLTATGDIQDESITLPPKHRPQTGVTLDAMIKEAFSAANQYKEYADSQLLIPSSDPAHPTLTASPFEKWTPDTFKQNLLPRLITTP